MFFRADKKLFLIAILAILGGLFFFWHKDAVLPTEISVFGWPFNLYSLFFAWALLLGYFWARDYAVRTNIKSQDFDILAVLALIGGFIGARLFYVWGHWPYYQNALAEIIQFWQGGLAFYGALIGGLLTAGAFIKIQRLNWFGFFDSLAPALALGQAIGRWGNFFNKEAFGPPTDLPWGIFIPEHLRPSAYENFSHFQPTFFYEFVGLLLIAAVLVTIWQRGRKFNGEVIAFYAILAGSLRFLIEFLRLDALLWQGLPISQIAAGLAILTGLIIYGSNVYKNKFNPKQI